jgi:hypothetical protein
MMVYCGCLYDSWYIDVMVQAGGADVKADLLAVLRGCAPRLAIAIEATANAGNCPSL